MTAIHSFLAVLLFTLNVTLIASQTCGKPAIEPATISALRHVRAAILPPKPGIMGGNEAKPHSWPWQVYYEGCISGANCRFCGGSLISQDQVLTAAHCVAGQAGQQPLTPSQITVRLGTHNINSPVSTDDGGMQFGVKSITVHSQWTANTFDNDIAILTLDKKVPFSTNVSPVCMATSDPPAGTVCYATGWGYTENGWKNTLRQVAISMSTADACQKEVNGPTTGKICFDVTQGKDTCSGDSGGPVVCKMDGGKWTVVGITSYGNSECATNGRPGIYTKVSTYKSWIMTVFDGQNDVTPTTTTTTTTTTTAPTKTTTKGDNRDDGTGGNDRNRDHGNGGHGHHNGWGKGKGKGSGKSSSSGQNRGRRQ